MPTLTLTVDTLSDLETLDSEWDTSLVGRIGGIFDPDTTDGEGLSLREALHLATLWAFWDESETVIEFADGLTGTIQLEDTLTIEKGSLEPGQSGGVQDAPTITINGDGNVTISGDKGTADVNDNVQLFDIGVLEQNDGTSVTTTFNNLIFTEGQGSLLLNFRDGATGGGAIQSVLSLGQNISEFLRICSEIYQGPPAPAE